jgi:hypothetical protein
MKLAIVALLAAAALTQPATGQNWDNSASTVVMVYQVYCMAARLCRMPSGFSRESRWMRVSCQTSWLLRGDLFGSLGLSRDESSVALFLFVVHGNTVCRRSSLLPDLEQGNVLTAGG